MFVIPLGKFSVPVPYWQAAAVVVLLFLLILVMAHYRRHYIDWSLKGGFVGVIFGFIFALILEGFLLVGGKTVLLDLLGWKNAPKPISIILDSGRNNLKSLVCTP
ncbi:MAG TPA: hypothetical protein VL401_03535 [Alphaproteobacteria bacterium]|jgi:hypothetical protein|nr:hypothetical protein [Alphaproteobacteria bacterium]